MIKIFITIVLTSFLWAGCSSHSSNVETSQKTEKPAEQDVAQLKSPSETEKEPKVEDEEGSDEPEQDSEDELEDEFEEASEEEIFDPLSGYNRFMTGVNDAFYVYALEPIASGYKVVMPAVARRGIGRFFKNLLFPVRFINNVLQFKFKNAGEEFARFGVNTTVGVLGFGDPAKDWFDLEAHPEDFGQTLGYYGAGSGFHIVLPVLGPSNLRDTFGLLPAHYVDPVTYIKPTEAGYGVKAFSVINSTSLRLGEYESAKKEAVDLYPFLRDVYEQMRNESIEE